MRRWMQFGWDENFTAPKFFATSNTSHQKGEETSAYPPIFLSMPYKATFLEILQGTSLADFAQFSDFVARIKSGGSHDAPADDCTAEHVVNGANSLGWRIEQFYTGGFWQMFIGGFPKPGGGFTPPLFEINFEPPSENG